MSNYAGRPPHGGAKITHHELCLGDCGHWDCMGCCYCPEDYDVECVKRMTATTDVGWLGWWFSDQIAQAEQPVRAIYEVPTGVWDEQSFDAGVKAARDAVEKVPVPVITSGRHLRAASEFKVDALAAIDGVKP